MRKSCPNSSVVNPTRGRENRRATLAVPKACSDRVKRAASVPEVMCRFFCRRASHGGASLLSRQVRMSSDASTEVPSKDVKAEVKKILADSNESASFRMAEFNRLKEEGALKMWNSLELSPRSVSKNELKREVKTEMELDELMGLSPVDPDLKGLTYGAFAASAVLGVAGTAIGGETGGAVYWLTYFGASIPLVLVGVGSVAPGIIGDVVNTLKWKFDSTNTKERRVRHEAAHMMCGYMCGLPIYGYQVEPEPLCEFYEREDGNMADVEKWKRARGFNKEEIARLAFVSCSGLMGELTKYDTADGGQQDPVNLNDFYFRAEGDFFRGSSVKEGWTRWGAYKSMQVLKENKDTFEKLYQAMDQGKSVEECIAVIEGK